MTKIKIGNINDDAISNLDLTLTKRSKLELTTGDVNDRGSLNLSILEKDDVNVTDAINELRRQILEFEKQSVKSTSLLREANTIVSTSTKMVSDRRWYSISIEGLLEAAKAVGAAASPLIGSAQKVVELLQKAKV